jgi:hypothetical protein
VKKAKTTLATVTEKTTMTGKRKREKAAMEAVVVATEVTAVTVVTAMIKMMPKTVWMAGPWLAGRTSSATVPPLVLIRRVVIGRAATRKRTASVMETGTARAKAGAMARGTITKSVAKATMVDCVG